jgi:RNA ligase (TIGR02306 family)
MENPNSVCYIAKINKIEPIENADNLELATINGWTSVVRKCSHVVGDLVLCMTTDAVIPEALAVKWGVDSYLRKGVRVRTVKLRGAYSECILIPVQDVGVDYYKTWTEGEDLMGDLNIHKYEPPAINVQLSGGRKHKYYQNQNFHIYYKFPNQKNTPNMFSNEDVVTITRKIHGTNARYGIVKKSKLSLLDRVKKFFGNKWAEYEYVYGSHNVEKGSDSQGFYSTDVWREIADKHDIKAKLWAFSKDLGVEELGSGFIIYGEIYGPGIQGLKYHYNLKEKDLVLFDMELNGEYLDDASFMRSSHSLSIPVVEELFCGNWDKAIQDSFVLNQFIQGSSVPHEGVVVKHVSGDRKKVSKVINPDYHIYSEKHLVPDSH